MKICSRLLNVACIGAVSLGSGCLGPDFNGPDYGYPLDDVLRVNHVQAKGTHNSYHLRNSDPVDDSHRYDMPALDIQLGTNGIRQLELDIHYSSDEGFTVFHIPLLDEETTCRTFRQCLETIKGWSDRNPGHHILFVWIEIKDLIDPEKVDDLDALDAEIRSIWPPERLLTPDDVQGSYGSLGQAVRESGWPTLGQTRDQIMFMLNNTDDNHYEDYTADGTSLAGRVMFVRAGIDGPLSSILKHGSAADQLAALAANLLVGDNAGGAGSEDAEAELQVNQGWSNGVHFLATDFPAPVSEREFVLELPGGTPSRCNPHTAPAGCTSQAIENLPRP